jgi:GNAT superfamily N-acetyltransferase
MARGLRFDASTVASPAAMGDRLAALTALTAPMLMALLPIGVITAAVALLGVEAQKLYPEFHDPAAPAPTNCPTPPRGAYVVAFAATQPVGMGAHQPLDHETSEVRRMFVSREARNQGVARAILMNIEGHARLQGFRRLVLETVIEKILTQVGLQARALPWAPARGQALQAA